jgi:hypothetical protein
MVKETVSSAKAKVDALASQLRVSEKMIQKAVADRTLEATQLKKMRQAHRNLTSRHDTAVRRHAILAGKPYALSTPRRKVVK